MSKGYFFVLLSFILLASCGQSKKEVQLAEEAEIDSIMNEAVDTLQLFEEKELPKAVDELFDDFFFTFASDTRFQNQRIRFPLRFKDENAELRLSKEEWHSYNRFCQTEFYSVIYEREKDLALQKDTAINEVCVQWIYLQDGYVEKYNFKRIPQGQWVLFDIEKSDVENAPNGEFVKFYAEFAADSVFQRAHIKTPISLHAKPEGDEPENNSELSVDEWFVMKADMPVPKEYLVTIDYGQVNYGIGKKNMLMEGVSNGLFVEFRFEKIDGEWKLYAIEI